MAFRPARCFSWILETLLSFSAALLAVADIFKCRKLRMQLVFQPGIIEKRRQHAERLDASQTI